MKLLLHICCAPCAIYPLKVLRQDGLEVMGFFYRHNIHPYRECMQREETLKDFAASEDLRVVYQKDYDMEGFIRNVAFREQDRCSYCYHARLQAAARVAKKGKFDFFSSTLLYSKFQKHSIIRQIGESVGKTAGVPFFYQDFRNGWKEGVTTSKERNMYRQPYCGCIYSEKERFFRMRNEESEIQNIE
ncbi:MAG: epoxyqueuosine reductase QueH [Deltaproteobacteria bacterium]|nr:epoxyqueuosine reductase QueH [Deltaproteobacteria bacterium]MBW2176756.1 epoxyqueuosine reductase QueH [Deltaproteobacteria bacterium]MBW2614445.1 epoxyqueuosine reductase QueH [Deltaproteobacteria bacterium]MBW2634679.1 epoxyqueuosine reductase QueH [Deltaproteobacteria bacterium]MBW2678534.1 epoxyqueuosine reductase QueH [Deltaproteobacteria bacterium]